MDQRKLSKSVRRDHYFFLPKKLLVTAMTHKRSSNDVLSLLIHRIQWTRKEGAILAALEAKGDGAQAEDGVEAIRLLVPLKRTAEYVKSGHRVSPLPWQVATITNCRAVLAADWTELNWQSRRTMISELVSVIRALDTMRKTNIEDAVLEVAGGAGVILDDDLSTRHHQDDFGDLEARRTGAVAFLLRHLDHPNDHAELYKAADEATGKPAVMMVPEGRLHQMVGRHFQDDLEAAPIALATTKLPGLVSGSEPMTPSIALAIALETVVENLESMEYPINASAIAICAWILDRQRDAFDLHYMTSAEACT